MTANVPPSAPRRRAVRLAAAGLGAAFLYGCGPDSKPVTSAADATDTTAMSKAAAEPCAEPAAMNLPGPPQPVNQVEMGLSPKAKRLHQNGCAGVRFIMAPDGTVKDATLVVEHPEGFGFGKSTLAGLAEFQFDPKTAKPGQYYYLSVFVQTQGSQGVRRPDVQ